MKTQYYHYRVQRNYALHLFFIFLLLCSHYDADLINKTRTVFNDSFSFN